MAINIDTRFPVKRLIEVMDKYIKMYLLAIYSYEDDLRIKYKSILMRRLRTFNKENPYFGRRIVSLSVKKLYYMSRLYYEEKHIIFLPDNVYFPKPDMILLDQQCYLVDYIENNNYSIFPIFDSTSQYDNREQKIIELLSPIIKKYTFNDTQLDIIKNKYYSIVCEKIQAGNIAPNWLTHDQDQDSDQDSNTYTDDLVDNEVTNNVMTDNDQILDQSFDTEDTYDSDEMDETIIHPIIDQADISIDSDNDIMDDNISINSFEDHTADLHINDSSDNQVDNQVENTNTNGLNLTQQARHTIILRLDYFQRNDLMNEEDYQHIIRSILQLVEDDR